jgi:glycosyltransferase involved in cell wall biosynthesis
MTRGRKAVVWGTLDPFHEGGEVMGRTMANGSFLTALLRRDPYDEYHFFLQTRRQGRALSDRLEELGLRSSKIRIFLRRELPGALSRSNYHCFHLSDCMNAPAALGRIRNLHSPQIFPITSTTHSLSYHEYASRLLMHLWPGSTGRDCIVTTSSTGRVVLERLYSQLERSYGSVQGLRPEVRQIPLGVCIEEHSPPSGEEKARARENLSIRPGQTVLLAFGRMCPHSKMDLLPLMRALQRVMGMGVDPSAFRLVAAGWAEQGDDLPETLSRIAKSNGLPLTIVLRPDERAKKELFRAADLFVSPADNPQETFGLTLLEAAAFGLPAIASEYDGYRDLVEHGRTGFLVPTLGPAHTELVDAMAPLCGDGHSHLLLGQRTVVRVPELAARIKDLLLDPGLRQVMGKAARVRVEESYSWKRVIERHLALWDELWSVAVEEEGLRTRPHPLQVAYSSVFSHYPSALLSPRTLLRWTAAGRALYRGQEHPLLYSGMEEEIEPHRLRVLLFLFRSPRRVGDVHEIAAGGEPRHAGERVMATILWALKHDLLETA